MRRSLLLALLVVLSTLCAPAGAQFCPGASPWVFDDVPANDLFCGYITWAAQNGITLGCAVIDANHRLYCPNAAVTRSQMAAFVNRLGNVRVESVGTGPGLTGGPITGVGTINLATTQLLPTTACANGQVPGWTGSAWACANPNSFPGNIELPDSTSSSVGNIAKPGGGFLHNYGAANTVAGVGAGNFFMTGYGNSALGYLALRSNASGYLNTANGAYAMLSNTTGLANTAVGMDALSSNTTGSRNLALGYQAGFSVGNGNDNIYLANTGSAGDSNTIRIGAGIHTRAFVAGIRGVTTVNNNAVNVVIDSAGQLGTLSSSRKVKSDIADMGEASEVLMKLHPVTFRYKSHRGEGPLQYGLIAEEVAEVAPELATLGSNGEAETVYYQHLAPMLLNEYQKQQTTIDAQAREIAQLKRAVEVLLARTSPEGRVASR